MYDRPLDKIAFNQKVSVVQEIIDTDTGEILFTLNSSVLFFSINFFVIILRKYFSLLRERKNLCVTIRSYQNAIEQSLPLDHF